MRQHGGEQSCLVTLTSDLESGVGVSCDMGYLYANFGLPKANFSMQFNLGEMSCFNQHNAVQ